jgi:hypothetical protein
VTKIQRSHLPPSRERFSETAGSLRTEIGFHDKFLMSQRKKILIQIDSDSHVSTFDSIVAIDAGIDQLITLAAVSTVEIQSLVHGAMFTRGGDDLRHTALFFGGSDVQLTESLVRAAIKSFFGPVRVSLMSDPNGSNTTAAAAVLSVEKHLELAGKVVTVLAATGPVGMRVVELAAELGATVRACSRRRSRAEEIAARVVESSQSIPADRIIPFQTDSHAEMIDSINGSNVVFSAGAAGVQLLGEQWLELENGPHVAVDLNAVPPAGIYAVEVADKAVVRNNVVCYGAVGVGGLKMKIHRECISQLFQANDRVFEIREIYEVGKQLR